MRQKRFHELGGPFKAAALAEKLGLTYQGDGDRRLVDVKPLLEADVEHLSFLDNPKYKKQAHSTKAGAVLVSAQNASLFSDGVCKLITDQPYLFFARALQIFYPKTTEFGSISPQAYVHPTAKIARNVGIGAGAFIGAGVEIGEGCQIGANVSIQSTLIGARVIIHPGAAIGQDGFGFAVGPKGAEKVPQVGGVIIGDDVEIGANTTIDRGALDDTIIGAGCKIDNLVQIGHNVQLGMHCQIVSQSAIAGSTIIGNGVVFGGQSAVAGHLKIADGVMLAARAGVTKNIETKGEIVAGVPAVPVHQWRRQVAVISRLAKERGEK